MNARSTRFDLCDLGVRDAADAIATRDLSPVTLLDALLKRIDEFDGEVRAWCYLDVDRARSQAASLTEEAAAGRLRGPLHGVPIGLKDVFHARGMPTLADSRALDPDPRQEDATVTARLRAAGAIILGKLHTAEFALADPPPTRNPWNLSHTPGGSSSGSGAAVAARMIPAALGTQTVGSTLRPAAYCGVAGLKPTYGRLSRFGLYAVSWTLDHPGIIARGVDDLALLYSVLAGPDPRDDTTLPDTPDVGTGELDDVPPRIGLLRDFFMEKSEPVVQRAIDAAEARFRDAGAAVRVLPLPQGFELMAPASRIIMQAELATVHARRYVERAERYGPRLRLAIETGTLISAGYYHQALRVRRMMRERLLDLFADVDVLLMPATPGPSPEGIASTGDATLLGPWSFVGYPALSINAGLSPEGLPVGLQLVAPPLAEERLFRAAAWCERIQARLPEPPLVAGAV